MNQVTLIGRLTKNPELRYTPNQTAVCHITLAVDRHDKNTDFINVTVYGKQAETVDRYMSKGRQIAINGRIQTGSYKNKDGKTVYTTDIIASNVEFLGKEQANDDSQKNVPEPSQEFFSEVAGDIPF